MIQLKRFQNNIVDKLLEFTSVKSKVNELIIKAPTGSGKTICLLSWIDKYISTMRDNVSFIWLTPGAGELEEQSQKKANSFPNIKAQSINDALLNGFEEGTTTFINYESVIGRNRKAMMIDTEKDNLNDKIEQALQEGRNFILIIDEAHLNDTDNSRSIISKFKASKIVRISATIDNPNNDTSEFYEVEEEEVIESGLITKSVIVNENLDINMKVENEIEILLNAAENKREEIIKAYTDNNITCINPLVLIQIPDKSKSEIHLIKYIEDYLEKKFKKTYLNGTVGIWLSDRKRNFLHVKELDNKVEYLIIKQAIATGWDAPRAKILVKIRENMGESFTIQTIGRIRRMPQPQHGHYGVEVLDNSYLYTFDSDFLIGVFNEGNAVIPTPILNLKQKCRDFHLISERIVNQAVNHSEKSILNNLYIGLKKNWGLTDNLQENRSIIKTKGFIISRTIKTTYKQGRFDVLEHADRLSDQERIIEASPKSNRLDLLHVFHELHRIIHLPESKVEYILKMFFLKSNRNSGGNKKYKLLDLDDQEWVAFLLNYWEKLREEFRRIDIEQAMILDLDSIQENDFYLPLQERYTYNPKIENKLICTNAYEGYTTSCIATRPSLVERLFERYIENHKNIVDFIYKNGDKGTQYFSIAYSTSGGRNHFYPDFIVKMKNGDIYIIETKGGKTNLGQDKNIDPYTSVKYEALKHYAIRHNVKWAFVRDLDEQLWFLNEGNWIDDMNNERWKKIDKLFEI